MSSLDIQTDDKIISPQTSIVDFYESQRADLNQAKTRIKQSKDIIRDKVRKIFAQGVMVLTGKAKVEVKGKNTKIRYSEDYQPNNKGA